MEFVAGLILGAVVGVIASVTLEPPLARGYARARQRLNRMTGGWRRSAGVTHLASAQLRDIGLVPALAWSPSRPLDPRNHTVSFDRSTEGRVQSWFPDREWKAAQDSARVGPGGEYLTGNAARLVGYTVDSGEGDKTSVRFDLTVSVAAYSDTVAVQRLASTPAYWGDVLGKLEGGQRAAIHEGPPQSLFVSLTVSTANGFVLASRRSSGAVATGGGLWQLGYNETMSAPSTRPGHEPETVFDLARRAALEEVGLQRDEIGPVWVSWFGFSVSDGPLMVAHTQTTLSQREVEERLQSAEGAYESSDVRWIRVRGEEHDALRVAIQHDGWLLFTPAVARGLWLVANDLNREPLRQV